MQLVCLGTGNKDLEDGLRWLEGSFRDQARGWVGFNVAMRCVTRRCYNSG